MKIKKLSFFILTTASVFQLSCINLHNIDFITAQPDEISQAIESHSVKEIAAKALDTGIANIPLANLELLLAHEQIATKIVSRINYIHDITKENVHLFIKPIADNFEHVNLHALGWIIYLKPNDIEPIVPIFVKNFKAMLDNYNDYKLLILKILKLYPDLDPTQQSVQFALDHFLELSIDDEYQIIPKTLEIFPNATQRFVQPAVDHFHELSRNADGHHIILKILELYPNSTQQFVQPVIKHFLDAASKKYARKIILKILELSPDTAQQLKQPVIDNFSSLINSEYGRNLISKISEAYCNIEEKHFIDTTEMESILLPHILKLTTSPVWCYASQAQYTVLNIITMCLPSTFMHCILNNFTALGSCYLGQEILFKILELYPDTRKELTQAAIDNISTLINNNYHYGKKLLENLIEHDPRAQKALDNYHFKAKVKDGLIITKNVLIIAGVSAIGSSLLCASIKYIKSKLVALCASVPK